MLPNASNFDYAAFGKAVAAALSPVQLVRVVPMHVLQAQLVDVGTTPLPLYTYSGQASIVLKAGPANSGTIYVGTGATVGAGDYPLAAGDLLQIDTDAELWTVASASDQLLHVIVGTY